jgi:hypothetical protein
LTHSVAPDFFTIYQSPDINSVISERENAIIRLKKLGDLFPDDWSSSQIRLSIKGKHRFSQYEFTIRLFSELGPKDYKFNLLFTKEGG